MCGFTKNWKAENEKNELCRRALHNSDWGMVRVESLVKSLVCSQMFVWSFESGKRDCTVDF